MSSRPTLAPLNGADEAKIVRALANGPGPGVAFQTEVTLGRRTLCVNAVRLPESDDARLRYAGAVSRRAEAEPYRLLPVAATGGVDGCHWVRGRGRGAARQRAGPPVGRRVLPRPALRRRPGLDEAAAEGLLPFELDSDRSSWTRASAS